MWRRLTGAEIGDIEQTIVQDIIKNKDSELKFYVGVDSDTIKHKDVYAVAIIMYRKGDGGIGYYRRETEKVIDDKARLFNESHKAIETAVWLNEIIKPFGLKVDEIHADLSDDEDNFSHSIVKACLGYITSMGFIGKIKPYAWAANKVAHNKVK